ncbi:malectin domain-containing carbohydrate-binding protein [Arachidicoccus sp.]|uniref:malectin domain-containing carbohydrate-binding protein n=1 Tax=Arachidicoccus sp. TaxID=1872624 RepID=UPI003D21AD74
MRKMLTKNYSIVKSQFIKILILIGLILVVALSARSQTPSRKDIIIDKGWHTIADSFHINAFPHFKDFDFKEKHWIVVDVPHNWDDYGGYIRLIHGNRHGYAWYRKKFKIRIAKNKQVFLYFEGVGSYATVWLNGKKVGYHAGGRTSFTLNVTDAVYKDNRINLLAVRADHPAFIRDLPWVCGGCSTEVGFSEGSQPMGIFRPVHIMVTGDVRVQPFGLHIWNDTTVSSKSATLFTETTVKNYATTEKRINVINNLLDRRSKIVATQKTNIVLSPGETKTIKQVFKDLKNVTLWSLDNPYLYHFVTTVGDRTAIIDEDTTAYGIRWISWPLGKRNATNQFFLNGKPVFINGIAGYEHAIGKSHAFTKEEIKTRVNMIISAGFNAFRDAHQPHNLLYQKYWDEKGVLWWPQFSAHIWFDTPAFKKNFLQLLKDWVIERRNSPSLILWGLQNESKLPKDFAIQCSNIIRQLDPTASSQRKITTCNGGEGTDWNVPQNWTGTYGGNPATYATDIKKQLLVGEYGGWRTIDLHTEGAYAESGPLSENRWCQLLEEKINLANSVKDSTCGQFFWLFNSHDNPGRVQAAEGLRELDRIGPVNYKGLLTSWEEPTDGYYMYRSNYTSPSTSPMVYIVSHTWPNRWLQPGIKDGITVYSNCDSVELFNDVDANSLGVKTKGGIGTHLTWNNVSIRYNVLYAIGYYKGKPVATDVIVLNHLPTAPNFQKLFATNTSITKPRKGYKYLYRINCGGPAYIDTYNNLWDADRQVEGNNTFGSTSWTADYPGLPAFFASQRRIFDPIRNTKNEPLFQTFRYGRNKLKYVFALKNGKYRVELYFTEPWWGKNAGNNCDGWRLFDVAFNDKIVLHKLDIYKEAGFCEALKKVIYVTIQNGKLDISFPNTYSGQAVISAIAIASLNKAMLPAKQPAAIFSLVQATASVNGKMAVEDWMDIGQKQYFDKPFCFSSLPPDLFGAQWLKISKPDPSLSRGLVLLPRKDIFLFVGIDKKELGDTAWLKGFTDTKTFIQTDRNGGTDLEVYKRKYPAGDTIKLRSFTSVKNLDYVVAANPVTTLVPAYDLKPNVTFDIAQAKYSAGIKSVIYNDKSRLNVFNGSNTNWIDWKFELGVADYHFFKIKYANKDQKPVDAKLELFASDGTLLQSEQVILKPSRPGKWNYVTMQSESMINAGHYHMRITFPPNSSQIFVSLFELQ